MKQRNSLYALLLAVAMSAPAFAQNNAPAMPGMTMPGAATPNPATPPVTMPGANDPASHSPLEPTPLDPTVTNSVPAPGAVSGQGSQLSNLSPDNLYPPPVADQQKFSFLLLDQLEVATDRSNQRAFRYDLLGWYGGDRRRFWLKSEGQQTLSRSGAGDIEVQALYGKLIRPYFDLQYGLRYDQGIGSGARGRAFGVLSLQGLSPYRFDVEPALFVDQRGNVSTRFTGTYDLLVTQRIVLQPRLETNAALQSVPDFGIGSGLNDLSLGLRLRYEIRREFAPYIGVTYGQTFGGTSSLLRREGERTSNTSFVVGVRLWF